MRDPHPHDESPHHQAEKVGHEGGELIVMTMWTQEAVQAENEYRRQQLRRLASHRRTTASRRSGWSRWLPRGLRH